MNEAPLWSADITHHVNISTVTLHGELDMVAAAPLRRLLVAQLELPDVTDVLAEVAAVTFLDSAALGALIVAYQHAEKINRHFVLAGPTRPVRRVLEISGLYDILIAPSGQAVPRG